jgi:hypothetical protein
MSGTDRIGPLAKAQADECLVPIGATMDALSAVEVDPQRAHEQLFSPCWGEWHASAAGATAPQRERPRLMHADLDHAIGTLGGLIRQERCSL